jgi:hypothetical protein
MKLPGELIAPGPVHPVRGRDDGPPPEQVRLVLRHDVGAGVLARAGHGQAPRAIDGGETVHQPLERAVGAAPVGRDRHDHVGLPRRLEQAFNVLHGVIVLDALADDLPVDPARAEKVHLGIGDHQRCARDVQPEAHGMRTAR